MRNLTQAEAQSLLSSVFGASHAEVGAYLQDGLRTLMKKHKVVGDVRGKGLLLGVELVKDRASKEPVGQQAITVTRLSRNSIQAHSRHETISQRTAAPVPRRFP